MNGQTDPMSTAFTVGLSRLRRNWGWLLALGAALIILGIIALVDSVYATVVSMFVFGWVLLIAGILEAVQAFRHREHGHLLLFTLNAALSIVVGIMLLRSPLAGAVIVTLLLAVYFIVPAFSALWPHWPREFRAGAGHWPTASSA